jgi:hypothetical protein
MKRWFFALVVAVVSAATFSLAQDAPLISPPQLQKMLKFLDKSGAKETFPAPVAHDLGLSDDLSKELPIKSLVTNDHKVYFCRSELDPKDYIVWVRMPDDVSSYMFLTHADFKMARAVLLRTNEFPAQQDLSSKKVQAVFRNALTSLAKDVDASPSP